MNDFIIEKIESAIHDNCEITLEYSDKIDYIYQKILWNNQSYYIKNIKMKQPLE